MLQLKLQKLLQFLYIGHAVEAIVTGFDPTACQKPPSIPYQHSWNATTAEKTYQVPYLGLPMRCDGHNPIAERMIVAAGPRERTDSPWMSKVFKIPYILYEADNPASAHHHWNVGLEAMAYLRFIAEYYDCLPEVTLFAHAHRKKSWHRSKPLDELVEAIRWENLPGFQTLQPQNNVSVTFVRDVMQNLAGKPIPWWDEPSCDWVVNDTLWFSREVQEYDNGQMIAKLWDTLLGPEGFGPVPEKVHVRLGAEFLIKRGRILARPRQFYLNALSYLLEFNKDKGLTSFQLAITFERVWHIIFGELPTAPPYLTLCELYHCKQ